MKRACVLFRLACLLYIGGVACKIKERKFPTKFMFGVSTSAYQIEGGWNEGGKGQSIWDVATHKEPSPIKDASTGDLAVDSYHQYKRDIEIMKDLGLDFYRFSISWPRILPYGFSDRVNQNGLDYYHSLIDELIKNNIKPFVTMYHWDLPEDLQKLGGWANPHIVEWFADYVKVLFKNFANKVFHWVTINEPKQICHEGYGSDAKAPFLNASGIGDYLCAKNVLLAHAKAYRLYETKYRDSYNGTIGIAVSCTWYEPSSQNRDDMRAAVDARMFDWGLYTHPIFSVNGDYPVEVRHSIAAKSAEQGYSRSRLPKLTTGELSLIKGSADFLGVNSYTTKLAYRDASVEGMYPSPSYMDDMNVALTKESTWNQAQSSWLQEVPWGLKKQLKEIKRLYRNPPVYILENGWSTEGGLLDDDRIHYLRNYLNALLEAMAEGCDVLGYAYWSLMDNFEWKNGYTEKFGLYEVDFNAFERTRIPRKSSFVYKQVVKTHRVDPSYEPHYVPEKHSEKYKENDVFK